MFETKVKKEDTANRAGQDSRGQTRREYDNEQEIHDRQNRRQNKKKPPPPGDYENTVAKLKRLLKGGDVVFNSVKAAEAIEAYHILDALENDNPGKGYLARFEKEYPSLFGKMLDNLPAKFLDDAESGFAKGISNEIGEAEDESGQDKMLALLKDPATWKNAGLLEMTLSILAQNKDTGHLAANTINQLPTGTKAGGSPGQAGTNYDILAGKGFIGQGKPKSDTGADQETYMVKMAAQFLFRKRSFDKQQLQRNKGVVKHFLGGKEATTEGLRLDKFQDAMGGHVAGMKFTGDDTKAAEGNVTDWLAERGVKAEDLALEQPDALKPGAISYHADLGQGTAQLLAASLPYERIDYIASDMSVRGLGGAFRKVYLQATWTPPGKKEKEGTTEVNLSLMLGEVEMNQLRIIMEKETYGLGRLVIDNATVNMTVDLPAQKVTNGGDFMFALMEILSGLGSLASNMALVAVSRLQGSGGDEAKAGLRASLAGGLYENLSVSLGFDNLAIKDFVSTEMGHIGDMEAGRTSLSIKPQNEGTGTLRAEDKAEVAELEEKLYHKKEKRAKTIRNKRKIARLTEEIQALSKQLDAKKQAVQGEENNTYAVELGTGSLSFKNAALVAGQVVSIIESTLAGDLPELKLGPLEGFDDISTNDVKFTANLSANGLKNTTIAVGKVSFPSLKSSYFSYTHNGEYEVSGIAPELIGTTVQNTNITISDDERALVENTQVGKIHVPTIHLGHLLVRDLKAGKILGTVKAPKLQGLSVDSLSMMGQESPTFGRIAMELVPNEIYEGKADLQGNIGSFGLESLAMDYRPAMEKGGSEADEIANAPSALTLKASLSHFTVPHLHFGQEGKDNLTIRTIKSRTSADRGVSLEGITASVKVLDENKVYINRFDVDHIMAANLRVVYDRQQYLLKGDAHINGFQLSGITYDMQAGDVGLEQPEASWQNLDIPKLWAGTSRINGLHTGQARIARLTNGDGYSFSLSEAGMEEALYQEQPGNEGPLKTLVKAAMKGKADINGEYKDDGSVRIAFALPEGGIHLPKIYYDDRKGNYLNTMDGAPLVIEKPALDVSISPSGGILVNTLHIAKLSTASGLAAQFDDISIKIPKGHGGYINGITMRGLEVGKGKVAGIFSTGEADIDRAYIEIGKKTTDYLKATTNLQWKGLDFDGDSSGAFTMNIAAPEAGLGDGEKRFDDALSFINEDKGIALNTSGIFKDTTLFTAGHVKVGQTVDDSGEKTQTLTLTDPVLSEFELEGQYMQGDSPIEFEKLVLGGQTTGDLVVTNSPDMLKVEGVDRLYLKEGTVVLPYAESDPKTKDNDNQNNENQFGFLDGIRGTVNIRLFDEKDFQLPIDKGYIELAPFLEELTDFLASKTSSGLAYWDDYIALKGLKDGIYNKEEGSDKKVYGIGHWAEFGLVAINLINDFEVEDNLKIQEIERKKVVPVQFGPPIISKYTEYKYYAKISAMMNTIIDDSKKDTENENPLADQLKIWINSTNAINPVIKIDIKEIDLNGMDEKQRGYLKYFVEDSINTIKAEVSFDQSIAYEKNRYGKYVNAGRKMNPIIRANDLMLPGFNVNTENMQLSGTEIVIRESTLNIDLGKKNLNAALKDIGIKDIYFFIKKTKDDHSKKNN